MLKETRDKGSYTGRCYKFHLPDLMMVLEMVKTREGAEVEEVGQNVRWQYLARLSMASNQDILHTMPAWSRRTMLPAEGFD